MLMVIWIRTLGLPVLIAVGATKQSSSSSSPLLLPVLPVLLPLLRIDEASEEK
jgi:hypothetical protein